MIAAVFDASALIAHLRNEPGATRVSALLFSAAMTTVNLTEVIGFLSRDSGTEDELRKILTPLSITWVPFDEDLAYRAGLLRRVTRSAGLSLGDRACLALAQRLGVPALTADRAWASIGPIAGVAIELIR